MTFKSLAEQVNIKQIAINTPVNKAVPGRESEMTPNSTGGYTFKLSNWSKLDRFLIIGTEGSTYYGTERALTAASITIAETLLAEDGIKVVDRCIEISQAGRAKNNDFALLVMAIALTKGNDATKRYVSNNLHLVARTGTHLMHFTAFCNGMRGWGKSLKKTIQNWYGSKTPDQIAYQAIKYQSRDGWSQRDIIRLAHPKAGDDALRNSVYKYIVKGREGMTAGEQVPAVIVGFEQAKTADEATLIRLIGEHRLSHEMIPNEQKNSARVWDALSQHMGTTALVRNLNKMTAVGLITPFSQATKDIVASLTDVDLLRKDRVHPLQLLIALRQYAKGQGDKGSLTWSPVAVITKALEDAFYLSFQTITPSNKNIMLALDVSASMNSFCLGLNTITCREAAAVMAMATLRVEPWAQIYGFDHKFRDLGITKSDSLATVTEKTYSRNFGATDMSLPVQLARQERWKVDAFTIYTDNEINRGTHPSQALKAYRSERGVPDAKLIAVGMAVNGFTIADPQDRNMLDVVGFDSGAPKFISSFISGEM